MTTVSQKMLAVSARVMGVTRWVTVRPVRLKLWWPSPWARVLTELKVSLKFIKMRDSSLRRRIQKVRPACHPARVRIHPIFPNERTARSLILGENVANCSTMKSAAWGYDPGALAIAHRAKISNQAKRSCPSSLPGFGPEVAAKIREGLSSRRHHGIQRGGCLMLFCSRVVSRADPSAGDGAGC